MTFRLEGKVALITGGASGIGAASARRFAAAGARVVVADLDTNGADVAAETGGVYCRVDVTVPDDCRNMVKVAEAEFGRLDILFANAGVTANGPLGDTSDEDFDRVVAVNFRGVFLAVRSALPALIRAGGGVVLTTASGVALRARAGLGVYGASKAAVIALTKNVALEYAKDGIRAIAICPGAIDTPMHRALLPPDEAGKKAIEALYPLNRFGTPEEVANAALFLASDEAAYVTGITFPIDGGRTLT